MKTEHLLKINAPGGIISPAKLKDVLEASYKGGAMSIRFGTRQDVKVELHKEHLPEFERIAQARSLQYEKDLDVFPNIVTSYPGEGIFSSDFWLTEGIYKDILDQFDYVPKLKVNLADNDQSLVPFFTGELNFVASSQINFWFLYINLKEQSQLFKWNKLIYSTDIAKICREIEELYLNNKVNDLSKINDLINQNATYISTDEDKDFMIPRYVFPYYEGLNRFGNSFWLGIYRRNYEFPVPFLYELTQVCDQTGLNEICITPWKTLLIKGIQNKDRILWEKLLGKHGINIRHSSLELNWVVDSRKKDHIELKNFIVSQFNIKDIRTFGVVFSIIGEKESSHFGSVIIQETSLVSVSTAGVGKFYSIYHTSDFNPNTQQKVLFAKNITRNKLAQKLLELCKVYYNSLGSENINKEVQDEVPPQSSAVFQTHLYQCSDCFTVYDPKLGDMENDVAPGTEFKDLPDHFKCPVCDSPKSSFIPAKEPIFSQT